MAGISSKHCYASSTWAWLTICAISLLTARFNWEKCGEIGANTGTEFDFSLHRFITSTSLLIIFRAHSKGLYGEKSLFYNLIVVLGMGLDLNTRCDVCSFWFEYITVILTINNVKREKINIKTFTFDRRVSGIFISFRTKTWSTLNKHKQREC